MSDRKLLAFTLTVFLLLASLSGGFSYARFTDTERIAVDVYAAHNTSSADNSSLDTSGVTPGGDGVIVSGRGDVTNGSTATDGTETGGENESDTGTDPPENDRGDRGGGVAGAGNMQTPSSTGGGVTGAGNMQTPSSTGDGEPARPGSPLGQHGGQPRLQVDAQRTAPLG